MADRPTRIFETTEGRRLILREYITGGENWEIRSIYMAAPKTDDAKSVAIDAEKKAFELCVQSIDDKTDNIAGRILDLPLSEYKEVTEQVTDIIEGKKKSETSSPITQATAD
jgi:hypothetical protein